MDCIEASRVMQEFLDGEAPDDRIGLMEEHIEHCPRCEKEYASMRELAHGLDSFGMIDPGPDFTAGVLARVRQEPLAATGRPRKAREEGFGWLPVFLAWAKGAAALATVILAFGMLSMFLPAGAQTARVLSTDPVAAIAVTGKDVVVGPGIIVRGNLTVLDGNVYVLGRIEGDVRVVRGTAKLMADGRVTGRIVTLESPVAQAKDAVLGAIDWFMSMYNQMVYRMVGP
jgi:anti-sigma factor RsiW